MRGRTTRERTTRRPRARAGRAAATAVVGTIVAGLLLTGCSAFGGDDGLPKPTRPAAENAAGQTPRAAPSASTPQVLAPDTVAAETDVVSKSGDTRIHVRVVADHHGTFEAELSGYRTTKPQWMSLEFRRGHVGEDDPSDFRAGVAVWDPDTGAPSSVSLADAGPTPDFLHSVVLVPAASDGGDDSARPWVGSVLAASELHWTIPDPYPHLHVSVGAARAGAYGWVHERDGRPASYQVATDDAQATVADRLGLTLAQLRWLNPTLQTADDDQLLTDTDLNLDPAAR